MIAHCKNCKWWGGYDADQRHAGMGLCRLTENPYGRDGTGRSVPAPHPETLALAHDADNYWAGLYTRHNFGCVQFEPLEDSTT